MRNRLITIFLVIAMTACLCACTAQTTDISQTQATTGTESAAADTTAAAGTDEDSSDSAGNSTSSSAAPSNETDADKAAIEEALNLKNMGQEWTYSEDSDAWVLSIVTAVTNPEIEDQQGVSACVPGAYVKGVDTTGDGEADTESGTAKGALVIDYDAQVTSTNGQIYTAKTAPVILNTGAAGYGSSTNTEASSTYAAEGYINVSCGNRGKQDSITDSSGNTVYTGDAPSCLVDQKNAARFVKYNILLGNLPGNADFFVSTGGSGGGAHAAMFAATSNNPDFYDYEIAAGAVGVYKNDDGTYDTSVTIDGESVELSDGAWGCIAYSAITSLAEADMAMAFEYYLDPSYDFGTEFQAKTAEYLAAEYMDYINAQDLKVNEALVGFDLDGNGSMDDEVALTIEYDEKAYPDTNGYGGTYLDFYLAEFEENLQWYLDNLDYAEGWTWFDADGAALSDEDVAVMTTEDKALAFIEGRYAKSSSGRGGFPGGMGGNRPDGSGGFPGGERPDGNGGFPDGEMTDGGFPGNSEGSGDDSSADNEGNEAQEAAVSENVSDETEGVSGDGAASGNMTGEAEGTADAVGEAGDSADAADTSDSDRSFANSDVAANSSGDTMDVGTPDAGSTQAKGSSTDSVNYSSYDDMLAAYQSDIEEVEAGDAYGNNIVELYDPLKYIGADGTENPVWARIVCGAAEGDISMLNSLNLEIALLNAGVDATIEWQWDGGHVPSEVLGNSFALWVDTMYGEHVDGAKEITKAAAQKQTENGTDESASGTDLSSWVDHEDLSDVSFTLASAAAYRTAGASKAVPGFDVIDYGQEDYVFGSSTQDARHWNRSVLNVFEDNEDTLKELFNAGE